MDDNTNTKSKPAVEPVEWQNLRPETTVSRERAEAIIDHLGILMTSGWSDMEIVYDLCRHHNGITVPKLGMVGPVDLVAALRLLMGPNCSFEANLKFRPEDAR